MTTGPILGTKQSEETVIQAARESGFEPMDSERCLKHKDLTDLGLQIHSPVYFRDVEEIVTEMELDDWSDRWPNNPEAQDILKEVYRKLPDLLYRDAYICEPTPVGSVSELVGPID